MRFPILAVLLGTAATAVAETPIRLADHPNLSPDARTLVFDWAGDVWAVSSEGGTARPLTAHPAKDTRPIHSPDGSRIAFTSDRTGAPQVYVMPATGGAPRQVTFHTAGNTALGWHPNGTKLLVSADRDHHWYARQADRLFLVDADERAGPELLFDAYAGDAALSPDGKTVLLTREGTQWWRKGYYGSQASQVWAFDRTDGEFRKLLGPDHGAAEPVWKPDGRGFYYTAGAIHFDLYEYDRATGQSRRLTEFADDHVVRPCVSGDGSTIAFRHLFDLYTMKPGTGKPRKLTITHDEDRASERFDRRALTKATDAAFTADGLEIALIAGGDLWVMDTELKEPIAVTKTAELESGPVFSRDGKAIYFLSDAGGHREVWKATRGNPNAFWWRNRSFELTQLTDDGTDKENLSLSPDGKSLAYVTVHGELVVADADGKNPRTVVSSFSGIDYDWSPDGKWLTYAREDENFNRDVWVEPLDGSRPAFNLSRHPYNDFGPRWSPDGKAIAFTGEREDKEETDVFFVWLRAEDAEKAGRARTLDKAIEKITKARGPAEPKPDAEKKDEDKAADGDKPEPKPKPAKGMVIDFDGIHDRVQRVRVGGSRESGLFWAPDGHRLAFQATVGGERGTYTVDITGSLKPTKLTSQTGSNARWLMGGIVWLTADLPASLAATTTGPNGEAKPRNLPTLPTDSTKFTALQVVDLPARNVAAFDLAWRIMRDNWYDEKLGNRNWEAVREKYIDTAADAPDLDNLGTVIHLMLGELNGSHLGFYPNDARTSSTGWRPETAHLGIRFVDDFPGPGLKVRDVLPGGPADRTSVALEPGDVILKIDDQPVSTNTDLSEVLTGPTDRDVALIVAAKDGGKDRAVTVRPIGYTAARPLLYEAWLRANRAAVDELSGGKLGYLHVSGMNDPSFHKFIEELYAAGAGKDGLVIDVRENGGGSTADHLLTALTQPRHAITVPRGGVPGYPQDRTVYAVWDKPIVVLCDQNSFSNAEIFSHAIKSLGRGRLVGVPTAGGVISTGSATVMDVGRIRTPGRGWFVIGTGEDMELNGAVPDHVVWPHPGDLPAGKDEQLRKAVEVLSADVTAEAAKPRPKLRKFTERSPAAKSPVSKGAE